MHELNCGRRDGIRDYDYSLCFFKAILLGQSWLEPARHNCVRSCVLLPQLIVIGGERSGLDLCCVVLSLVRSSFPFSGLRITVALHCIRAHSLFPHIPSLTILPLTHDPSLLDVDALNPSPSSTPSPFASPTPVRSFVQRRSSRASRPRALSFSAMEVRRAPGSCMSGAPLCSARPSPSLPRRGVQHAQQGVPPVTRGPRLCRGHP